MSTSWKPPGKAHARARYSPGLLHACIGGGSNCRTLQACQARSDLLDRPGYQQVCLSSWSCSRLATSSITPQGWCRPTLPDRCPNCSKNSPRA